MPHDTHTLPRFGFDDKSWAVIVAGRSITLDDLEQARLTQAQIKNLGEVVRAWAEKTNLPLAYVHMGTTANWYDDREDLVPKEGADAIIGLVMAYAAFPEPRRVTRADLTAALADRIPAGLWEAVAGFGLSAGKEGIYLAPAGWAVAELYAGEEEYDTNGQVFAGGAKPLVQTCSEDFPPGALLDPDQLPESLWLRPFYA